MPNYFDQTLIPAGDNTNNGWFASGGPATITECIDDYASGTLVNDSDYARHNLAAQDVDYDMFFDLNWSADLEGADSVTRCVFDVYWSIISSDDENWIHAGIYADATTTTPYVLPTQVAFSTSQSTYLETSSAAQTITAAGQAATKTEWQNAKLMIRCRKNHVMGGDSSYIRLGAIRVRMTDLIEGAPTPPSASLELTPGDPPVFVTEEYLPVSIAAVPKTAKMELFSYAPKPPLPFFDEIIPPGQLVMESYAPQLPFPKPPAGQLVLTSYAPVWETKATQAHPPPAAMEFTSYAPKVITSATLPSVMKCDPSTYHQGFDWTNIITIPIEWDYPGREGANTLLFTKAYCNAGTNVNPASQYRPGNNVIGCYFDNIDVYDETGGTFQDATLRTHFHWPQDNGDGRTSTGAVSPVSDFGSSGGEGVNGWQVWVWRHWNEADPNQTQLQSSAMYRGKTPAYPTVEEAVFMGDGSIPIYGNSYNWVCWFYGRDVHNDNGYLFAVRTTGSDTVPVVYRWTGGDTWTGGTDIFGAVDLPGANFTSTLCGWCRADQSNPDRVYVAFTTNQGGTIRFHVVAVDLSNIAGYTEVIVDSTNYGTGRWNVENEWDFPEPCFPIERRGLKYYYVHTNDSTGADSYTRIILNDANWLAPTIDQRLRGGNSTDSNTGPPSAANDPMLSGQSRTAEHNYHGIVWDDTRDAVFAIQVKSFINTSALTIWYSTSWKDLDRDDPWTDWTPVAIQSYDSSDNSVRHNEQGGIRNWGIGLNGEQTPFFVAQGTYDTNLGGRGNIFLAQIRWWEERTLTSWKEDITVNIKGGGVTATPVMEYNPGVTIKADTVTATTSSRKSLTFDGQYNFLEPVQLADIAVTIKPDSVTVYDDEDINKLVTLSIKPDSVSVGEVVSPANWTIYHINDMHWSQSWTDDFIALVNVQRTANSLPPVAAIDNVNMLRYTTNQQSTDTAQTLAEDMARLNTIAASDPGYTDVDQTARVIKMNPAVAVELRTTILVEPVTSSPTAGRIIDDVNFPTASEAWNGQQLSTLTNFFSFDFDDYFQVPAGTNTELYLQIGMDVGPRTGSDNERDIYVCMILTSYTGQAYEPWGGAGNVIQPTVDEGERGFYSNYWFSGTSWNEEVVDYINELRESFNLKPFVKPDRAFYEKFAPDMATKHSFNCLTARYVNHNDETGAYLPAGERLVSQRVAKMGIDNASENIVFGPVSGYINNADPNQIVQDRQALTDDSIMSPFEAFDSWFNSPGHYQNMIRSWGGKDNIVCLLGWDHQLLPAGTTIFDEYHGTYFSGLVGWYSIITNKFLDATIEMAYRVFDSNYQIDGAGIEVLDVSYSLTAYEDVKSALSIEYAMRVTSDQALLWGARVTSDHAIPTFYSLASAHGITYNGTVNVADDHLITYKVDEGVKVASDHELVHSIRLQSSHRISFGETLQAVAKQRIVYGEYGNVAGDQTIKYAIAADVISDHSIQYSSTQNVISDHTIDYEIATVNTVASGQRLIYTIASDSQVESAPVVTITVGTRVIDITDLTIAQDEDSPAWFARARIASNDDYTSLQELQQATLSIAGEDWTLIITEKQVTRRFGRLDMQIKMESPVVLLMNPRALPQTYRYEAATPARTIVEEILGQSVTWDILTWTVPAGRFAVDESTPYAAAESLVKAAGGIIQSNRDGTLVVRYHYPVAMNQLGNVTPDHVFTDVDDNLSVANNYEYRSGANRFRIAEGDSTFGDTLEWVVDEEDDTKGTLRAFLSPWRSSYNLVYTDSDGPVVRSFRGTKQETLTEVVEFVEGSGSTESPIYSITSVNWLSDAMTYPAFEQFSNSLTVSTGVREGYGLAEITYVTQFDEYYINGKLGLHAQFIIEDEE